MTLAQIVGHNGWVTAVERNLWTTNAPCCSGGETALVKLTMTAMNSMATGAGSTNEQISARSSLPDVGQLRTRSLICSDVYPIFVR
jgi:hypothetical protein